MKNQNAQSGFSLIEMLVSIAIFMVVAVIAVTALLKIVDASKKSQTLQDTVNNVNFAMDSITRELRVGKAYTCGSGSTGYIGSITQTSQGVSCLNTISNPTSNSGTYIAFLSSNTTSDGLGGTCNLTYAYYFEPIQVLSSPKYTWTIEKAQEKSCGVGVLTYAPIIDPSIVITSYTIKVNIGNSNAQPSVFLYIKGYTGTAAKTQTYFDLQTTISKRGGSQ
jgi:prepilin-type N-terminal cleavage/methylation domain-containing protein